MYKQKYKGAIFRGYIVSLHNTRSCNKNSISFTFPAEMCGSCLFTPKFTKANYSNVSIGIISVNYEQEQVFQVLSLIPRQLKVELHPHDPPSKKRLVEMKL